MTPNFFKNPDTRNRRPTGGFALVVTVSLMVLLAVVALGLLTLSAIELRATAQGNARAVAMANARLAMVLALGDLQKKLGPDRGISASASLAVKEAPLGVTGAWEPWTMKEQGVTYAKAGKFRGWLTSAALSSTSEAPDKPPHVAPGSTNSVILLGNGSLGDRAALKSDEMRIAMPKLATTDGHHPGNLAWVTIDESTKSRLDLHRDHPLPASIAKIATAGAPATDGVFALNQLENVRPDAALSAKMITYGSSQLATKATSLPSYSPDLSNWSISLLTDPVAGGVKKDLSTLFTRGLTAAEAKETLYARAGLATGASDPPLSLLAGYHDLYKRLRKTTGNSLSSPEEVAAALPPGYQPTDASGVVTPTPPTVPLLIPSVLGIDMIFSLVARPTHNADVAGSASWELVQRGFPYRLYLMYLPVVTLHNPYDVPLVFDALKISFDDVPIEFQFQADGEDLTKTNLALNQLYMNSQGSKSFGITLKSSIGSSPTPLRLGPGQTKLFGTPRVPPGWTWQDELTTGLQLFDWGNGKTKSFEMAPRLITQSTTTGCGFTTDHLIPGGKTAKGSQHTWKAAQANVALRPDTRVGVKFGPATSANNRFRVSIELVTGSSSTPAGVIDMSFESTQRLTEILTQGTSARYPQPRRFPALFPDPLVDGVFTATDILEPNDRPMKDYVNAKPFAIFSFTSRTTKESFYHSRPFADGSPAVNLAKFNVATAKEAPADLPFEMVMMPIRNNTSALEEIRATEEAFAFGGHGTLFGTPRATFYEFPRIPMQSLAQFRHANLAGSGFHPFTTYTAGESRAHPLIPSTAMKTVYSPDRSVLLDHTWLSNTALWDSYFLSTLADYSATAFDQPGSTAAAVRTKFFTKGEPLLNPRIVPLVTGSEAHRAISRAGEPDGWRDIASRLAIKGGFNVNSTSVDAWAAVISSLRDLSLLTAEGPADTGLLAALPRVRQPSEGGIDGKAALIRQRRWQGFRQLDNDMIQRLASQIVAEVRSRGPFLSLSEFVNRRIGPASDERSLSGAVEAAITKTALNGLMAPDGIDLNAGNLGTHNYHTRAAAYGPNTAAAPGHLTQGDVLSLLGSRLTMRGDTFVIRSYGDATEKNGKVLARAWCEAVVQRFPAHVDPTDPPEKPLDQLNATNQRFGRAFKLVSFRWLAPQEV